MMSMMQLIMTHTLYDNDNGKYHIIRAIEYNRHLPVNDRGFFTASLHSSFYCNDKNEV